MSETVPAPARGAGALTQQTPLGCLEQPARDQVADFADTNPNWDGIVLIPGDPTHWIHLSAGEVISFQSFLTVQLARALGAALTTPDMTRLSETMARPERLATHLNSATLSGHKAAILGALLGAELAAAKVYWLGQQVVIFGDSPLAEGYRIALQAQGVPLG